MNLPTSSSASLLFQVQPAKGGTHLPDIEEQPQPLPRGSRHPAGQDPVAEEALDRGRGRARILNAKEQT